MDVLKQIIERFRLNVLSIEDVPESFSSTVYKIQLINDQTVYVKIPYTKDKLNLEYTVLERFKHELPVPKVLEFWEGNDEITGALLLSAIDGASIVGEVDQDLAYDIGVHHAKLHAIIPNKQDFNSPINTVYHQWEDFIKEKFYSFAEDVKKVVNPHLFEQSIQYFEQHQNQSAFLDGPSFIHMDFRPANILIRDNKVVGIIDFESVRIGATEIDFTKINRDVFMKFPGTMEAYQKGYNSIRTLIDLQEVLPFYRFNDAFNSIGWCQKRGIKKHQEFLQENLSYLQTIIQNHL